MHLWRGYTTSGEPFKWFNILLIDTKIHAYVPETIADVMESQMVVGNMYLFKNFTLKEYKPTDRFRCIHKDIQIIFSSDTKAIPLDDNDVIIEKVMFDFYDLSDLKQLSRQTTYLTGVYNNKGFWQSQIKFEITDGRTQVKVTFWDIFADIFAESLHGDLEYP
ncbi:uncharacterized protein LOC141706427 [Apium graveolens]|uniref:uncharacterized protein LOC141706427 n=1 Tax=Apium graveolens TaxID=4045 RepID=UPI003D7B4C71